MILWVIFAVAYALIGLGVMGGLLPDGASRAKTNLEAARLASGPALSGLFWPYLLGALLVRRVREIR